MLARITADVGSRIARTAKQGKVALGVFLLRIRTLTQNNDLKRQVSIVIIIVSVAIGSWCLGLLFEGTVYGSAASSLIEVKDVFKDAQDRYTCPSLKPQDRGETATVNTPVTAPGSVVGSKNGSKYHLPTCPGARSIKEENKIWFASEAAAQAAGYTRAGNCK